MNLILLQIILIFITLIDARSGTLKVKTKNGNVRGKKLYFGNEGVVTQFLGIPFGKISGKKGRFMPPQKLKEPEWKKTLYGKKPAKTCYQQLVNIHEVEHDTKNVAKRLSGSCLQLNMWVPEEKSGASIVFIYGDNFDSGSPSLDLYNGSVLALKSKAIVVNINYRVGIFGFAYLGENSTIKGNMGLLDQQLGLQWVYDNIENFGGNKHDITLLGDSAGAASVTAHMFSDGSKNLFSRAFVSSGVITNLWATSPPHVIESLTRNVTRWMKCDQSSDETLVKCLQDYSWYQLGIYAGFVSDPKQPPEPISFTPINKDSVFFKGSLSDKLIKKDFKKDVDLAFGRTLDIGALFIRRLFKEHGCRFDSLKNVTSKENRCLLRDDNYQRAVDIISRFIGFNKEESKKLYSMYENVQSDKPGGKIDQMISDFMFDCRVAAFADYFKNSSHRNVLFYDFRKRSYVDPLPKWMLRPMHSRELEYIFGYPLRHGDKYPPEELKHEQNFSNNFMKRLGHFAKFGNFGRGWLKYRSYFKKAVVIDEDFYTQKEEQYVNARPQMCNKLKSLLVQFIKRAEKENGKGKQ